VQILFDKSRQKTKRCAMTDQPKKPRNDEKAMNDFENLLKMLGVPIDNPAKALNLIKNMLAAVTEERDEAVKEREKLLAANKAMADALEMIANPSDFVAKRAEETRRAVASQALAQNENLMKEIGE
jgi:hypothetical protein